MKKIIIITTVLLGIFFSCKKSATNDVQNNTNTATVTFTNASSGAYRVVVSSTDSLAPFTNFAMDVDLAGGSSITKSIPEGRRWLYGMIVCKAGQSFNAPCTTYVKRTVAYLANNTYTEIIR
jgi:hypothetical protein